MSHLAMTTLRNNDSALLLLVESVPTEYTEVTGNKLPTYKEVLLYFLHYRKTHFAFGKNNYKVDYPVTNDVIKICK